MVVRRRRLIVGFTTAALVLATLASIVPARAATIIGDFEVDGNLVDSNLADNVYDWDTLPAAPNAVVVEFLDPTGSNDNSMGGGSKELEPLTWTLVNQSVPQKDDLLETGIATRQINGEDWLYIYSRRRFGKGAAFIGYEFNKLNQTFDNDNNPATPEVPRRSNGDLLVLLIVTEGGTDTQIDVFVWNGTHTAGTWDPSPLSPQRGTDWEAVTDNPNGTFLLSEGALRLQAFDITPSCPGLGQAWVHTISSHRFNTATMKDRTDRHNVPLSNCGTVTVHKIDDQEGDPLNGATFELLLDSGAGGTPDGVFSEVTDLPVATCVTGEEGTDGACTFEEVAAGSYWVREIQAPAGYAITDGSATLITVAPGEQVDLSDPYVNRLLLPEFTVNKSVTPGTIDLSDGDTGNDTVTYTITVTNVGEAPGSTPVEDDYDQAHLTDITLITAGGTNNGDIIRWDDSGSIEPGSTATFEYSGRITGTFGEDDPSDGCGQPNEYPVVNGVTVEGDSASETVCVVAKPKFSVVKASNVSVAQIGDQVDYTITVSNIGAATGSTAVSDDYDEAHLTSITGIDPASGIDNGDTITWADSGPIAPGADATFGYAGTITGSFDGPSGTGGCEEGQYPVLNMVSVDGDDTTNTVCVPASPDFTIEKEVSPTSVNLMDGDTSNDTVTYTIRVTNIGSAAGSTIVTDDYDEDHLVDIAGITPADGVDNGDTIVWETETIPAGGFLTYSFSGRIVGGFTGPQGQDGCGENQYPVLNRVSIPDDEASATVCVTARPKFQVVKTADPTTVDLTDGDTSNDTVAYTIRLTNLGEAEGSTTVTDDYDQNHLTDIDNITPPSGVDDGFTITWLDSGPVASGQTVEFSYTGRITGDYTGEPDAEACPEGGYPVVNVVAVDGDDDSAIVCVIAEPLFSVEKTADPSSVDLSDGDTSNDVVTYTIVVTNSGAAEGSTLVSDDYDEAHLTDIADITPADGVDDGDTIEWDSGLIAPNGGTAEFSYTGRITGDYTGEPGAGCEGENEYPVVNTVEVDGDDASAIVCVLALPAFSVEKTADPSSVDLSDGDTSNDVVTYTILVTNNGAAEGSTLVSDDYDEAHLTDIADITPADGVDDGDTIEWDSGLIAPNGGTAEFSYTGRVYGPFSSDEANPELCEAEGSFPVLNRVTVAGDEATEIVCAETGPDFDVEKSVSPTTVDLSDGDTSNDIVTYTITVTNGGSGPGSTPVNDDYDEAHLTDISGIDPNDGVDDGSTIAWADSGMIQPGSSAEFSFSGRVVGPFTSDEADAEACESSNEFPVLNRVDVDGDQADAIVCVRAAPNLVVEKSADVTTAQLGDEVTYTITVENTGQGPGSTGVSDDYDQAHLDVDDTTIDPVTGIDDGDFITWATSGVIEAGASASFTYTGALIGSFNGPSGGRDCGEGNFPVVNQVTIDGDDATYTVCVPAEPQFTILKSADPTTVDLSDGDTSNDVVTYTLTVENVGDADGIATAVDDFDEQHLVDIDAGGGTIADGTITFESDTILAGETRTFTYSGRVVGPFTSDEAGPGCEGDNDFPVINLVEVLGPDGEVDDSDSATVCANAEPELEVTKVADPTSIDLSDGDDTNDTVTYTIVVRNVGQGPGSMAVVDDYDQNHFEPTSIDPADGVDDGDTVTWQSGTIEPGGEETFTLAGTIFGPFDTGEAGPECEGQDEFPVDNVVVGTDARAVVCVHASPHLTVEKAARNLTDGGEFAPTAAGEPGEQIEYRIVVTNDGASTATGVQASDAVPAGMTFVSCEPALSCSEDGGVVTWNVGILLAGQDSGPLTMIVTIGDGFEPGFTLVGNIATATRDGGEPEPSNPVTVTVTELRKHVCTANPIPGAAIEYTIPYGAHGGDVHGVVLEDILPEHVLFESASPAPTSAPAAGESGTVRWELGTLTDGTAASATIRGRISLDASEGDVLTNVVTLSAEGVPASTFTLETEVIEDGEAAANAQGLYVDVLGNEIGPMPDSDEMNPDELLAVEDPITGEIAQAEVLSVSEGESVDKTNASANAVATAADVRVVDTISGPGENWLVTATAVRAVSSSNADLATAGSSSAGSKLVGVTVLGQNIGTVNEPTTIEAVLPGGLLTATVKLLEEIPTGAADGVVQPDGGTFASGLTVNGIHVLVTNSAGDVVTEVIVSAASSDATFLSGLACGEELPRVSGTGYALGVTVDETLVDEDNTLLHGEAARVRIPITGGEDSSTQAHVGPLVNGTTTIADSNAAFAHSLGVADRDAGSGVADTEAEIERLRLLQQATGGYLIEADVVRSEVHAEATGPETSSATGSTTLAGLVINGTDVCESLGLESVCTPEPNTEIAVGDTVLVILNEQIEGPSGPGVASLTVNAIHIFVLGQDNPFGLPVGAEIIVSSSHAGAHAEGGMVLEEDGGAGETLAMPSDPAPASDAPARGTTPVRPVPEAVKPSAPKLVVPHATGEDDATGSEATTESSSESGSSKGLLGGWFGLF